MRDYWGNRRRELVGAALFFGAIAAAMVLTAAGVSYGLSVAVVLVAFVAGALLLSNA
jgi:uncharacterized membrane protein